MRPITPAVAALLLLAVAGCGVSRSAAPSAPTTTTTTATTTATTTTTPTTTTTVPPAAAADGANLQACQDRTCEVSIKARDMIPVGDQLGVLTVLSTDDTSVTLVMPGGSIMTFDGALTINDTIVVENLRTDSSGAIVRITPAP